MEYKPSPILLLCRRFILSIESNGLRGAIASSCRRLFRSFSNNGLSGTLSRAVRKAPAAPPKVEPQAPAPQHPFDLRHGTDTGGFIPGANLSGVSLASLYSTVYLGISPSTLTQALAALPLQLENFTFVDLGCGKGRALLIAAQFPFRKLLGVELSFELVPIAQANTAKLAERISILNQDAATISFPETPLVIFLFHPFLAPTLRRVLANLERQLRHSPRETYLLYANNPRYNKVLERFPFLREVSDIPYPLSPEDIVAEGSGITHEHFTLYSADHTR